MRRNDLNYGEKHDTVVQKEISIPGITVNERSDGEQWVQRIMEGEYSDLRVEERLDALVALISAATEGNSIRIVREVCKFSVSYYSLYSFPFTCSPI